MISIIGYGSLLSESSARETVPDLCNFRLVRVPGYRRIFNKVGIVFLSRHGADPQSLQLASCATEADKTSVLICSQFECSEESFSELYEREHRFEWVDVESVDSSGVKTVAKMCTQSTDEHYRFQKCGSEKEFYERVGRYYQGPLWRDDILPFPRYLAFCLQAAEGQGADVLDNFLDTSYLADGCTSIRRYLDSELGFDWRNYDCSYSYQSKEPANKS
ncbi:hypothetical protein [Neptuniibacter caesariensis]|uniref:Gamma-glutamylcyclotransferase n=1 Tax=Neptuniibacter caesariensis TaxID=207954 RepID=A0A7U8C5E4_NEPCE|nr:hypothetical protein [Neptuniibacter caesariensis]EAR61905.1 hypothetical protein MED92_03118 [Oceanospirillum sp. MED92] [Neptuniibacter caesariensis]